MIHAERHFFFTTINHFNVVVLFEVTKIQDKNLHHGETVELSKDRCNDL